ncbi:MAG: choice-of-anchor B family protein [Algibacter sp.]
MIIYKKHSPLLKLFTIGCICFALNLSCKNESVDNDPIENIDDIDNDDIIDSLDNCQLLENPNQLDTDADGLGDLCDDDDDNDNILDADDNCPFLLNPNQDDDDNDGIGNLCDSDYINPTTPLSECVNGFAGIYPCSNYNLMAQLPLDTFGAAAGNDSWGWTDPTTGKEYALMATNTNVAFIDITNTAAPIYLGSLPTATQNSSWRDVKVYKDHAFIVADVAGNHGMQVFDLTRLRNVTNPPESFTTDTHYTGFGSAHNVVINTASGYAYIVGTNRDGIYEGGPLFINIQDPKNPIDEGGFGEGGYSHDAQVITYNGPDTDYTGHEILIGSNEDEVVIVDVTDKANPIKISNISYSNVGYAHQGWFTEDMNFFILGDELDERNIGTNTRTIVFNFSDLDNPSFHMNYLGPHLAIDHNGYVKGDTFYLANYTAGLRMIDVSQIANETMTEIGYFDSHPENDGAAFDGAWNVYPYFPSGNIIISDINRGLFVIRKKRL